jgi:peptide/nickel transport system permease protein
MFWRNRRSLRASVLFVGLLVMVAVVAPWLAPYSPTEELGIKTMHNLAPSVMNPFGTDPQSRDVLSRVLYGARVSLFVATASVAIALMIGLSFGAISALAGGWIDGLMMRVLDVIMAIPRLLILLAITAIWLPLPFWGLVLVIGATGWYDVARLVRGEIHGLLGRDFVLAAQAAGVRRGRLLVRHLLPHLLPVLAVSATLGVAHTIALEAALSYLGLGVQEPTASWGLILHSGVARVSTQWWLTFFPGLATVLAVLACNALGDALRDVFTTEQVHE